MPSGELAHPQQRTRRFSPRTRVSWTVWAHHGQQWMRFPAGLDLGHVPSPRQEDPGVRVQAIHGDLS
jgi:hypothetical protein